MPSELREQHLQLDVVARLESSDVDATLDAVADVSGLSEPVASQLLDHLEAEGLVYKDPIISAFTTAGIPSTVTYGITKSGRRRLSS
jgi:predicted ArsR family transcriptional regulator